MRCLLILILLSLTGISHAHAQSLDVTEQTQLSFGAIQAPTSGSVDITVDVSGNVSGTATLFDNLQEAGIYKVTGSALKTIDIDIMEGNTPTGVSLGSFTATYDGTTIALPATGLAAPGFSGRTLRVGTTATVSTSAGEGNFTPQLDIIVDYTD